MLEYKDVVTDEDLNCLCKSYKLSLRDPKIEENLFPHVYPYGGGGFADSTSMVKSLIASM